MSILTDKKFWVSTAERAIKTFGESVLSLITVGQTIASFDWFNILSISATATLISVIVNLVTELGRSDKES